MSNYLRLLQLHNMRRCPYQGCKKILDKPVVETTVENGEISSCSPSGDFLFHYQDTHGFPHEMMLEELEKMISSKMREADIKTYNHIMKNHEIVELPELSFFDRSKR